MLKLFSKAAARFAAGFAAVFSTRAERPSAAWRRVYGDGAPAFSIE
jgi:hypothetical protein